MNESVIRSPKWLRNFVDFEVNTGEDIKGEPSKRKQKKIEAEKETKRKQKEKEQEKRRQEEKRQKKEEERRQEEKRRQEKEYEKEERSKEFDKLFPLIINYIYSNYKDCKISIPNDNFLTIEESKILLNEKEIIFKITLDNNEDSPTFDVYIKYDKKVYNYTVYGYSYILFKEFLFNTVYKYYINNKKSSTRNKTSDSYNNYDDYKKSYDSPKPPKSEDPEKENKRRRYKLLKDTKDGYKRQMEKIIEWEKKNPGKKHPDDINIVKNQIDVVQRKLDLMNSLYHFESHHYSNVLSWDRI